MGMSIDAKLIYGVPYTDIPEELIEQVDEMLDEGTLDYASPWYDSSRKDWIVGVAVGLYGDSLQEAGRELFTAASSIQEVLKELQLGFYVSPHVT